MGVAEWTARHGTFTDGLWQHPVYEDFARAGGGILDPHFPRIGSNIPAGSTHAVWEFGRR
jgi:hypothetical protein